MNQHLIDNLTNDLKPVCPLCPYTSCARLLGLATLAGVALLLVIGMRPDLEQSAHTIIPYWKCGIFILIGVGALFTLCRLGLPGRGIGWVGPSLMTAGLSALIAFALGAIAIAPNNDALWHAIMGRGKLFCFFTVSALGILLALPVLIFIRRFAFTRPGLAGWLIGTGTGAFGAAAYAWHCMVGQTLFVAVWYTLPVIVLGLIGFLLGPRLLRL